jgi:hypothetical protein
MPEIGNLAWAAVAAVEGVEIHDRFNGVPTLGTVRVDSQSHLFWRALFYVSDVSIWMYVPLTEAELHRIETDDDVDPLDGLVFDAPEPRFVAVAAAGDNRIVFEREWKLPAGVDGEALVSEVAEFMLESLQLALDQDMPATRRDAVQRAADAVRELIPCD